MGAQFQLASNPQAREKQLAILQYRQATQPYGERSAGCVFCNPEGLHAGILIEQAGLKGCSIGGAAVSTLHANFIINQSQATCRVALRRPPEVMRGKTRAFGPRIRGVDAAAGPDVMVFHAGTKAVDGALTAAGGRVLAVTARAASVTEAQRRAYAAVDRIDWPQGFCRRDIGYRAIS